MQVELRDISDLKPYPANPRKNEAAVAAVAESIQRFGWRVPIVVDEDMTVICGHTRLLAAQRLGLTEVPVHIAHDLTPEQAKAYRLADNRSSEISEWDLDLLNLELAELKALDFPIDSLGWSPEELDALLSPPGTEGNSDPDDVPEPPETPVTQPGDLWRLGEHRLLCGDSTKAEDVERVMDGAVANLLFCDPPYGVAYQTKLSVEEAVARRRRTDGLEVANDDLTREGTRALVASALANAAAHLKPGASFYVCAPAGAGDEGDVGLVFRRALEDAGLRLRQTIAWVKDIFVMGRQDYHWRHEDILYGERSGPRKAGAGRRPCPRPVHRPTPPGHAPRREALPRRRSCPSRARDRSPASPPRRCSPAPGP